VFSSFVQRCFLRPQSLRSQSLRALMLILVLILALASSHPQGGQAAAFQPPVWLPMVSYQLPPPPPPPDWSGAQGSIICLLTDPRDPNLIYAGTWGGGVFRSEDQGDTWSWAGSGMSNYLVESLAMDPTDSRILYAGTHGGGIFKTTNGGQSWLFAGSGLQADAAVYAIAVHPGNNQVIFAGTRKIGTGLQAPYQGILYKSDNGGASWYPVLTDVGGPQAQDWVYSIAIKANPPTILVATHEHGPYLSTTGEPGDWQPAHVRGLDDYGKGRAVAFDPRPDSTTAYYATWHGGFYRSTDNGHNWFLHTNDLNQIKVYPNGLAFGWERPDLLYAATMDTGAGVMKSINGGYEWESFGLNSQAIYTVASMYPDGEVVLAGTAGEGIFKSVNGGNTWSHSNTGLEIHPNASP